MLSMNPRHGKRYLVPVLPTIQPHVKAVYFILGIVLMHPEPSLASAERIPLLLVGRALFDFGILDQKAI